MKQVRSIHRKTIKYIIVIRNGKSVTMNICIFRLKMFNKYLNISGADFGKAYIDNMK